MKLLIHEWSNYLTDAVYDVCQECGIEYDSFNRRFTTDEYSEEFLEWFDKNIDAGKYDFVLSVNYWPMVAMACYKKGYRYVAWCCDCPLNVSRPEETMNYETNYVFLFDRNQYKELKNIGIDTVHYLPLGTNAFRARRFRFDDALSSKYNADVSFVGSLYESQLSLISYNLDDATTQLLHEMVKTQEELYNYNLFGDCVTDGLIDYMNKQYLKRLEGTDKKFEVNKKALYFSLSCEVTRRNRLTLLNLLGRRYDTKLYSFNTFDILEGVKQCGTVDYLTEMPYVFKYSKINLNPVLRCIETGIPLRAFDIMGYGGFLLSNYQQELDEYFIDGEDLVMYDCYADAVEKANFYLQNDNLREKVVKNGQKKVLENFTLQIAFKKILEIVMK